MYHAHFLWVLPKSWRRQSDCRIINITWYKNVISIKRSARRQIYMCYIRCRHAVLTNLATVLVYNRSMAGSIVDPEVRISKAISYATKALGYSELRPNQELAVKHFLRGHDVSVSLPTGSGKSLCYCLFPKAFDFLRQKIESIQPIVVVVSPPSSPQISEAYVVRRGTSGRDDALKSCLRLPVLRSEAAQRMQNTETDDITGQR